MCTTCIQVREPSARVEHEASTSKIGEDQLFYFQQRGIDMEEAVGMIISGARPFLLEFPCPAEPGVRIWLSSGTPVPIDGHLCLIWFSQQHEEPPQATLSVAGGAHKSQTI